MLQPAILLIDDDEDDISFFEEAVYKTFRHVTFKSFQNCMEALKALKQHTIPVPDFIFLDLNMPKMNGKQCLLELRKIDGLKACVIVMYSTTRMDDDEFRKLGANYFLTKPVYFDMLRMIIRSIIESDGKMTSAPLKEFIQVF